MADLPTRMLCGRPVSAVSLGCMNLSHAYGAPLPEVDGIRLLNHALDIGVTHLDTAALYGGGNNERLLAKAVMHRRDEFLLSTKGVLDQIGDKRLLDGRPETIAGSIDRSLQRLGLDYVDLYYLHRLDKDVPIEDSVGAVADAVKAGKVGAIGLSEMGAATIRRAQAAHPIAAVQTEYSLAVRNPEVAVLQACADLGIAFVAFSPVARGLLAGGVTGDDWLKGDIRTTMPRFNGDRLRTNLDLVARFATLAREGGFTPAQVAIAWLLSRAPHIIALPGTTSIAHLEEDVSAATANVPPEVLAAADKLFPWNALSGPRYAAFAQAQVDTETLPDEELA